MGWDRAPRVSAEVIAPTAAVQHRIEADLDSIRNACVCPWRYYIESGACLPTGISKGEHEPGDILGGEEEHIGVCVCDQFCQGLGRLVPANSLDASAEPCFFLTWQCLFNTEGSPT